MQKAILEIKDGLFKSPASRGRTRPRRRGASRFAGPIYETVYILPGGWLERSGREAPLLLQPVVKVHPGNAPPPAHFISG